MPEANVPSPLDAAISAGQVPLQGDVGEITKLQVQTQAQHALLKQELGYIGKIFGSRQNAPSSIAGICVIFALFALIGLLIWGSDGQRTSQGITIFAGLVTLAMGYLFGRSSGDQ